MSFYLLSLPPQLSFVFAEFPMRFVLNGHLNTNKHILHSVKTCGKDTRRPAFIDSPVSLTLRKMAVCSKSLIFLSDYKKREASLNARYLPLLSHNLPRPPKRNDSFVAVTALKLNRCS